MSSRVSPKRRLAIMSGLVSGIHVLKTRQGNKTSIAGRQGEDALRALAGRDEETGMDAAPDMLTEAKTYDELYQNFRWDVPARFNIATACCDRYADGSGRLALVYVDEDGGITRTSFDEVADASRRFAN